MRVILASKSPRRKMLLKQLGLDFEIVPSNIDETVQDGESPRELVKRLAKQKAESVARNLSGENLVIGADTIVYLQGKVIGKPRDRDEARNTLRMLSGKTHEAFTGLCLINTRTGERLSDTARTLVTFRDLSERDIEECVKIKISLTGAGSYTPELYSRIFEKLDGSYNNVVGLPTELLIPMLRGQGIDV
jgi:septum formation protein